MTTVMLSVTAPEVGQVEEVSAGVVGVEIGGEGAQLVVLDRAG